MEEKKSTITKWIYWFLFALAVILVYKTLDNFTAIGNWFKEFLGVIMPFLVGILIAYLLYIPCRKVENTYLSIRKSKIIKKIARPLSVFTVYFIAIVLLVIVFNLIIPVVSNSIIDLASNFQGYYNITINNFDSLPEESILKNDIIVDLVDAIKKIDIKEFINLDKIAEYAKGAIDIASKIFDFFVSIIVSVYLLLDRRDILNFFKKAAKAIFKKETYEQIGKYFNKSNEIFFKFLSGQVFDAIIVGIITSIAMSILGVKYAVLLGFMIGLFNLIPYFGAIVAVIIAAIITILTGGIGKAITMVIVVVILQQIDSNIINPRIIGNSVKISPLLVIFAVTIGGAYLGVWGMFLAVPIFAVLKLMIIEYIEYKTKQKEL